VSTPIISFGLDYINLEVGICTSLFLKRGTANLLASPLQEHVRFKATAGVIYLNGERGCNCREMTEELARILAVLERSAGQIQQKYKATILGVFGSYVRGEQTHDSDLDLLVRFHEDATLLHLVGLGNFLEEQLGVKVDLVSERAVATAPNTPLRPELKDRILQSRMWCWCNVIPAHEYHDTRRQTYSFVASIAFNTCFTIFGCSVFPG